ncbi:choice-of-anchor B family protein [Rubrivirga sp.]|uniref:choice-of-anchor B family protein n=1 Tax=Rubrivirga sp. TaxID=1885344 RepID=UPI003B5273D1
MRLPYALAVLSLALLAQAPSAQTPCVGGSAGAYPCEGVDLMAHLPLSAFVASGSTAPAEGNDIWGWTDPSTGKEYALVGLTNGTAFVDVTAPASPVLLGILPTATSNSSWRDIKTIGSYAYIVSEAGGHGMQVFDLTRLRGRTGPAVTFTADARYTGYGSAHNIVVLEDADLAIGVGASTCAGGLEMVDVSNPLAPVAAGCFSADGYTHDAQCLSYAGPDADHSGRQICVASNEDSVTIVDVTNPAAPVQISKAFYPNPSYTHQGWFTEDQRYFIVNDELDGNSATPTRTIVMDLLDLDVPEFGFFHDGTTNATDHNLYVVGDRVFQSNYTAGLQILDASTIASGTMTQVAFFDTEPANNNHGASASTGGQWSNYPFFASGTIVANDIKNGLFVLAPQSPQDPPQASVTPPAVDQTLAPDGAASVPITVANGAGGGNLLYAAELENLSQPFAARAAARPADAPAPAAPFAEAGLVSGRPGADAGAEAPGDPRGGDNLAPLLGDGGPDAFGYAWIDSDETGGPAVDFQDIAGTGTAVAFTAASSFPAGDEGYADVALPFDFPFYGGTQSTVRVFTNGFLTFSTLTGNTFSNGAIPGGSAPNNLIAPFWDDLDLSAGGTAYTGTLADGRFVVQFTNVRRYNDAGSSLTFQAILSDDGGIEFQYGSMAGATLASASVGIEDAAGSVGLPVVVNGAYVSSNKAVRFFSPVIWATLSGPTNGTVEPGTSATFDLDLDAAGLPQGIYTADLVVSTNDPAVGAVTVDVTLTVGEDGGVSIVIDGPRGFRYLGPPSEGVTVDDLAAQNLVRGVPGYYPAANPANLYTEYDTEIGKWDESRGTGEVLELGRAFQWFFYNRDVGNPDISRSRKLPFTLSTDLPANTANVELELDTDGNRFNFLANPFATDLDLTGIYDWPGGDNLSPNAPVWTFDPAARAWTAAPATIPAWMGFRVRAKGPRVNGIPRLITIPASAPVAARQAAQPGLSLTLSGTDADGVAIGDRAMTFAFRDEARAAFDPSEDVEKFQTPATAYALIGARNGRAFVGHDARPFADAEIPLAVEARGTEAAFTLRWDATALPAGLPVVLVDLATGAEVDVRTRSSYSFEVAARAAHDEAPTAEVADGSAATDRFVLRIGTGLGSAEAGVAEVALEAVAPNPSSGGARVAFAVPEAGAVRVSVIDVRGREVAVLMDGSVSAGRHEARLDGGLAAGVYVVRLEAGGRVLTRRAVVVR